MSVWSVARSLLSVEERWAQAPRQPRGVPTGLAGLDALTRGFRPREVTLLAARTSHGKSALALTIAINALKWELVQSLRERREPRRVLYLSPEMHPEQLLMRLASAESHVNIESVEDGTAGDDQRRRWREVLEALEPIDPYLVIEGGKGYEIEVVEELVRSNHGERQLLLVVIDYIQRINHGPVQDEYRRLSLISQALKDLANEIEVPFLVLSQLNRQIERDRHQADRMPDLSDLRGSGRLEEDADNVWLLWREPRFSDTASSRPQSAVLFVAKARNGKPGLVDLWFWPHLVAFTDVGKGGKVRADGGTVYTVAGQALPSLVWLSRQLRCRFSEGKSALRGGQQEGAGLPEIGAVLVEPDSWDESAQAADPLSRQPVADSENLQRGADSLNVSRIESIRSVFDEQTPEAEQAPVGVVIDLDAAASRFRKMFAGAAARATESRSGSGVMAPEAPSSREQVTDSPKRGSAAANPQDEEDEAAWLFSWGDEQERGTRGPPRRRRRGADFEKRLAKRLGGYRWPGLDGDIETPEGWRIECKYRAGLKLDSTTELREWLEQVTRYARKWPPGKRWAVAITGGRSFQRGQVFVLLPLEAWLALLRPTE